MAKSLGIFVTTEACMPHLMGITKAAKSKGANIKIFFTWKATNLSKDPAFAELCEIADDVSICVDSYQKQGYSVDDVPAGLTPQKMATQAQHGIIIEDFDCYLSL
ncbi:peroxiredoxin [Desulfosediminicola flagellatus]|uniref:peroxiredoxin n=1 Tax=Desulfosediminicola flagellatus TaxID=2569541 RepID=UPI0010AD9099|nr:peroxiredoxin [Desulfosediminicola flagellatus]